MINELIEKVDQMDSNLERDYREHSADWYSGWDEAIDKTKEILEAPKPRVLDKPNCNGWWYFKANLGCDRLSAFYFLGIRKGGGFVVQNYPYGPVFGLSDFPGFWYRAIMPDQT